MTLAVQDVTLAGRLSNVSLALRAGALTAICGPNGAGKSTLLACLAGLTTPEAGSVLLDGSTLAATPAAIRARRIGYLPQSPQIAWDLSVEVLVSLGRLPWPDAPSDTAHAATFGGGASVSVVVSAGSVSIGDAAAVPLVSGPALVALLTQIQAAIANPSLPTADAKLAAIGTAIGLALPFIQTIKVKGT